MLPYRTMYPYDFGPAIWGIQQGSSVMPSGVPYMANTLVNLVATRCLYNAAMVSREKCLPLFFSSVLVEAQGLRRSTGVSLSLDELLKACRKTISVITTKRFSAISREDRLVYPDLSPEWVVLGLAELHACWILDILDINSIGDRLIRASRKKKHSLDYVKQVAVMLFLRSLSSDDVVLAQLVNRGLVVL